MSFLDNIRQGVSLRKSATQQNASAIPNKLICNSDEDYTRLLEETSFDHYYEAIKPFTFQSLSLDIGEEEAKALLFEHDEFQKFKQDEETRQLNSVDIVVEYSAWKGGPNASILLDLSKRIDEKIAEMQQLTKSNGVFCRLSTLSPKDAAPNRISFVKTIHEKYLEIKKEEEEQGIDFISDHNRILYALYKASISILKIEKGEQAVQLLIESKRARQEFKEIVDGNTKTTQIIIREWNIFDVAHEFRAFVFARKVTAMTQYNPVVYFPHLVKQKDQIEELILQFLEENILNNPSINIQNFVLDIVLTQSLKDPKQLDVKIVELNPLAEFTGTILFSWEKDRSILTNPNPQTVDFRMLQEVARFGEQNAGPEWQESLSKLHTHYLGKVLHQ